MKFVIIFFYLRGRIYPDAARKIQNCWACYLAPKKVALSIAYKQLPPSVFSFHDVSSLHMVRFLEYFVKVLSGRERNYVWVLFLDYIQDDLWQYDHLLVSPDDIINYDPREYVKRSENAYKILRRRFGYTGKGAMGLTMVNS